MSPTKPQTTSVRRSAIRGAISTRKSNEDGLEQSSCVDLADSCGVW
jgi:hypothetical protein